MVIKWRFDNLKSFQLSLTLNTKEESFFFASIIDIPNLIVTTKEESFILQ